MAMLQWVSSESPPVWRMQERHSLAEPPPLQQRGTSFRTPGPWIYIVSNLVTLYCILLCWTTKLPSVCLWFTSNFSLFEYFLDQWSCRTVLLMLPKVHSFNNIVYYERFWIYNCRKGLVVKIIYNILSNTLEFLTFKQLSH